MNKQESRFLPFCSTWSIFVLNPFLLFIRIVFFFVIIMGRPQTGFCLTPLTESQSRSVVGASGVSIAADDVMVYLGSDSVRFESRNNRNLFDNITNADIDEGIFSFTDTNGLFTVNNTRGTLDIGAYQRPSETYRVADIFKDGNDYVWLESGRKHSLAGTGSSTPKYWTIPNPTSDNGRTEPMDGQYGVVQAEVNDLFDTFDLTTTLGCQGSFNGVGPAPYRTLSTLNISGIHMPQLTALPGAKLTLYPDSNANINMELRTRLTIDEVKLSNPLNAGYPDLKISGIHLGEAFYNQWNPNPLPSHLTGTGGSPIDTSSWGSSFSSFMYSGYFLIGNLNQVDFDDFLKKNVGSAVYKNGRQIYNLDTTLYGDPKKNPHHDDTDNEFIPLWITPNPVSINIGMRDDPDNLWDGYSYISMSAGIHGSIRVESIKAQGQEFGPIAIDGLRVKHLEVEFPGGRMQEHYSTPQMAAEQGIGGRYLIGTTARGLVWEGQEDYLNNLQPGQWQSTFYDAYPGGIPPTNYPPIN